MRNNNKVQGVIITEEQGGQEKDSRISKLPFFFSRSGSPLVSVIKLAASSSKFFFKLATLFKILSALMVRLARSSASQSSPKRSFISDKS